MSNNIRIKDSSSPNVRVKVKQEDGRIQSTTPISIKGLGQGVKSLDDIGDVEIVELVDGATLVYNEDTQTYQIKKLSIDDLVGELNLDFGTF